MNTVRTSKKTTKLTAELTALKNTITELKNKLAQLSSRLDEAEGKINLCQRTQVTQSEEFTPSEHEKKEERTKR